MTDSNIRIRFRGFLFLTVPILFLLTAAGAAQARSMPGGDSDTGWKAVSKNVDKAFASGDRLFYTLLGSGDIYSRKTAGLIERIGGPGLDFACSDFYLWGASPDGSSIWFYADRPGGGGQWVKVYEADVEKLYSGGHTGRFIYTEPGTKASHYCFRDFITWDGPWNCYPMGGPRAAKYVIRFHSYCLAEDLGTIWIKEGKGQGFFQPHAGGAADIAVGTFMRISSDTLYTIDPGRTKVTRTPHGGSSEDITYNLPTTNGIDKIEAGYNTVVVLIGEDVWLLQDTETEWTNITGGLQVKEVYPAGNGFSAFGKALYCLTTDNTLYRYDGF